MSKRPVGIPKEYLHLTHEYERWVYCSRIHFPMQSPWVEITVSKGRTKNKKLWNAHVTFYWDRGSMWCGVDDFKSPRAALTALKRDIAEKTKDLLVFPGRRGV